MKEQETKVEYDLRTNSIIVNEEAYIGQNSLMAPIFPPFPSMIPQFILDNAAKIGTEVHELIQTATITRDFDNALGKALNEPYADKVNRQVLWGSKFIKQVINPDKACKCEVIVYDTEYKMGGLIDIVFKDKHNRTVLIDIKTRGERASKKKELEAKYKDSLQLWAYKKMWDKMRNDDAIIVILYTKQEKYTIVKEEYIPEALLKLYETAKKMHLVKLKLWGSKYWKQ